MNVPKQVNRHCPSCKKHTPQKITINRARSRSSTHPLSRGSNTRIYLRGQRSGYGNKGKYSKPPKPKMTGKKMSKKTDFRYTCSVCGKMTTQKKGKRAKKVELI